MRTKHVIHTKCTIALTHKYRTLHNEYVQFGLCWIAWKTKHFSYSAIRSSWEIIKNLWFIPLKGIGVQVSENKKQIVRPLKRHINRRHHWANERYFFLTIQSFSISINKNDIKTLPMDFKMLKWRRKCGATPFYLLRMLKWKNWDCLFVLT